MTTLSSPPVDLDAAISLRGIVNQFGNHVVHDRNHMWLPYGSQNV